MKRLAAGFLILANLSILSSTECFAATASQSEVLTETSAIYSASREAGRDDNPYEIGPQNLLQIKIFGEANINQLYRVDEAGYIKHALIGRVQLGGMTVSEAEKKMEQLLDGDYIINPQVTIFVLEYSHFSIIGEVRKPGSYELSGRISLIRAISIAGGFTPIANQKAVQIIRKSSEGSETKLTVDVTRIMQSGDIGTAEDLQAEDVVVVPKSFF